MAPRRSTISVIVPTWRRPDRLLRCLDGLAAQTFKPSEILIVVRPGDRETMEALTLRTDDAIRKVEAGEPGLVAALNAGLASARGEIIAFTDDDAIPRPDWLTKINEHFGRDCAIGGVGGRDRVPGEPVATAAIVGRVMPYGRLVGNHHLGHGPPRTVDFLKGVNMSFRTAAVGDLEFDNRMLGQGAQPHSEIGFCMRLARRGWKLIYDPALLVEHDPGVRLVYARASTTPDDVMVEAHNELLGLLAGTAGLQKLTAVAYALSVGSRRCPGPLLALERSIAGLEGWGALTRMRAAMAGRRLALSALRRPEVKAPSRADDRG